MFERYTEKARRVIFYSRYEASQWGSPFIETQHLLMGLLREAPELVERFKLEVERVRERIDETVVVREKISTKADLPLSNESKRVLAYAAEEAEGLSHRHIGAEHLLLGLLREKNTLAAMILEEFSVSVDAVREQFRGSVDANRPRQALVENTPFTEYVAANSVIATARLQALPRVGDELTIVRQTGEEMYIVEAVRFVLAGAPVSMVVPHTNELMKVQVRVRRR
jgi:ATP-dependent Clp protease ATP-binding subunit ClpC